jgi:hypothetical protein
MKSLRHPTFETFDPEDLVRFERGYPDLVELVDDHPHDKKPDRWVVTMAGGVDPVYEITWPREVATRYVTVFPYHSGFKTEKFHKTGDTSELEPDFVERFRPATTPSAELFAAGLDAFMPGEELYSSWKWTPALYIYEQLLGGEVAAREIVRRLARYDEDEWVTPRDKDGHTHGALEALGFMLLRMDDAARARILAELAGVLAGRPADAPLTRHASLLPDGSVPYDEMIADGGPWFMKDLARDGEYRCRRYREMWTYPSVYHTPRYYFLEGCAGLLERPEMKFPYPSKRNLYAELRDYGRIKHAGIVRYFASMATVSLMRKPIGEWMGQHADYVASVRKSIEHDAMVKKGFAALEKDGLLSGAKPAKKAAAKPAAKKPAKKK